MRFDEEPSRDPEPPVRRPRPATMNAMGGVDVGSRPTSGLRALVVEDEAELAALVGSYLERDGFEVTIVGEGRLRSPWPARSTPT